MESLDRILDVECRARTLNLSINRLCKMAGVRGNNISRWRREKVSGTIRVLYRDLRLLEAQLDRAERDMFWRLAPRTLSSKHFKQISKLAGPATTPPAIADRLPTPREAVGPEFAGVAE